MMVRLLEVHHGMLAGHWLMSIRSRFSIDRAKIYRPDFVVMKYLQLSTIIRLKMMSGLPLSPTGRMSMLSQWSHQY
jgi:hypothetical protein